MIIAAAIKTEHGIYTGPSHMEAAGNIPVGKMTPELIEAFARGEVQGFLTSDQQFLDRCEAYEHALTHEQIRDTDPGKKLRSQMLVLPDPKEILGRCQTAEMCPHICCHIACPDFESKEANQ